MDSTRTVNIVIARIAIINFFVSRLIGYRVVDFCAVVVDGIP